MNQDVHPIHIERKQHHKITWLLQLISLCLIVVWLINPISSNIYELAVLTFIWLVTTLLLYGKVFFNAYRRLPMLGMLVWPFVLLLLSMAGHSVFGLSYIMYFFIFGIGQFYLIVRDKKTCYVICLVALLYCIIIAVNTLMVYTVYPSISRVLARSDVEEIYMLGGGAYITPFIGGYGYIYGLVFIIVGLLSWLKNDNKTLRLLGLALLLLFTLVILRAQYFIALMLFFLAIALFIILDSISYMHVYCYCSSVASFGKSS